MSKLNKITEEELETVLKQQKEINSILVAIGSLETQKHSALHKVASVNEKIEITKKELEDKYGQIDIDLSDGSYKEIEKEK